MKLNSIYIRLLILLLLMPALSSCSTTGGVKPPGTMGSTQPYDYGALGMERVSMYHTVAPGETLWRISKMYDVDVEAIQRANRIQDVTNIDIGTKLYIPGAARRKDVITLYPNDKWQYIIVHHSATDVGNSQYFDKSHKNRGWEGVGYHFVIDNGTCGKDDGQIETTPRWLKQENGAHCKASGMNEKAIGICLVGNFSEERVTSAQMRSLIYLVQQIKDYYNVPKSHIMGHGQVPGAQTECPGTKFPWKTFRRYIK